MSNKYDSSEHIKVLAELLTLQTVMNETQVKIIYGLSRNAISPYVDKIRGKKMKVKTRINPHMLLLRAM